MNEIEEMSIEPIFDAICIFCDTEGTVVENLIGTWSCVLCGDYKGVRSIFEV